MRQKSAVHNRTFCDVCGKEIKGIAIGVHRLEGKEIYIDFKADICFKMNRGSGETTPDICKECAGALIKNMIGK